jgi:prepilin-type N-terminal cleavage/methylation domain-containing protein
MKTVANITPRRPLKHLRQKGVTMVELSLVLIIAGLIIAAVTTAFGGNSAGAQANQLAGDMSALVGRVRSAYAGQYANITNAKLNTGGFLNGYASLTNNAGVVTTSLGGGTLTVSPGTVTAANDSAKYVLTQMPDEACQPFVTAIAKTATTLNVGANVVKAAGGVPDPSKVTCASDNTTITFQVQ